MVEPESLPWGGHFVKKKNRGHHVKIKNYWVADVKSTKCSYRMRGFQKIWDVPLPSSSYALAVALMEETLY